MPDFVALAALAVRMVKANGRQITIQRLGGDPTDPAQPWKQPSSLAETVTTYGVMLSPQTGRFGMATGLGQLGLDFGDLVKSNEELFIVAGSGLPDLTQFHQVVDRSITWKIRIVDAMRPQDPENVLLYTMRVHR